MESEILEFGEFDETAEYELRPGAYAVIRNELGEIAVVVTPKGVYLPGGGMEEGESPEETAVRETLEETGLQTKVVGLLGIADELVYSISEARHFRKRCSFFSVDVNGVGEATDADHELIWLQTHDAAVRLSHKSQAWAAVQELA